MLISSRIVHTHHSHTNSMLNVMTFLLLLSIAAASQCLDNAYMCICSDILLTSGSNTGRRSSAYLVHSSEVSDDLIMEYKGSLSVLTEEKYGSISNTLVKSKHISSSCVYLKFNNITQLSVAYLTDKYKIDLY